MFKIILVFILSVLGTEVHIMELVTSFIKTFFAVIITLLLSLRLGVVVAALAAFVIFAVTGEASAATVETYEESNKQLTFIGYAIICVSFSVLALVLKKTK